LPEDLDTIVIGVVWDYAWLAGNNFTRTAKSNVGTIIVIYVILLCVFVMAKISQISEPHLGIIKYNIPVFKYVPVFIRIIVD